MSSDPELIDDDDAQPEQCASQIRNVPLAILLLRLRNRLGIRELEQRIGCDQRVISNYINQGTEPRWQRGRLIYNLAVEEFCNP